MNTPTIVKQTRDYLLIKVPLPKEGVLISQPTSRNGKTAASEKRGWGRLREAERDIKAGRVITAKSVDEALRKYAKRKWG